MNDKEFLLVSHVILIFLDPMKLPGAFSIKILTVHLKWWHK